MVPRELLRFSFEGDEVVPHYFLERDHLWLRTLLDEYQRYEGKPRRELTERLEDPLPMSAPSDKVRVARHVLDRLWRFEVRAAVTPRHARAVLFGEAARHAERDDAIAAACATLAVERGPLLASLLADLADERVVLPPEKVPSVAELAQRANLSLVSGMLRRAVAVTVDAGSDLRAVVRQAKLKGLLCTVEHDGARSGRGRVAISGPYALFRRTLVYGRALATLIPVIVRCHEVELRAACMLEHRGQVRNGDVRTLVIRSGDPLFPRMVHARHDSKLEARFFRDFAKLAPQWDVIREPAAVQVGSTIIFPDFELRHRFDPARRWLVEVAGFWTPDYVEEKLARLRAADLENFILCIDAERNCATDALPERAHVVRYRRWVDAEDVLRIVEGDPDRRGR